MRGATPAPRPDAVKKLIEKIILVFMFAIPIALIALA